MKSARQVASPTRRSIRAPNSSTAGQAPGGSNQRSSSPGHGGSMDLLGGDEVTLQAKIFQLEKDLERRQESYITRERAYKVRIDELEEELTAQKASKTGWMKQDKKLTELKQMQHQILNNVELVQDRTARIMQEQERDLLRAFKARLFDVQTELEKEKSKKDDGAAAWIEKSRQLEAEVEWAKEVADRLERVNQTLLQENNRLKSQFTSQEEDRNFLIKQLVSVKKDNARLRAEYSVLEAENERTTQKLNSELEKHASLAPPVKSTVPNAQAMQLKLDSEERYKEVNVRLKRLLTEERKSLMQIRQNYAQELKVRTDMEMLLRQCVDDVRQEIARRHVENAQFSSNSGNDLARLYSKTPGSIPVEEFGQEDRERVLELLLSQERVVSLVYAKTFPVTVSSHKGAGGAGDKGHALDGGGGGLSLDVSALLDGGALGSPGMGFDDLNNLGNNSRPHTASAAVNGTNSNGGGGLGGGGNETKSATKLPQLGSRVVSH